MLWNILVFAVLLIEIKGTDINAFLNYDSIPVDAQVL